MPIRREGSSRGVREEALAAFCSIQSVAELMAPGSALLFAQGAAVYKPQFAIEFA
jgi:hypothetical protein